jgi:hypothetical protein
VHAVHNALCEMAELVEEGATESDGAELLQTGSTTEQGMQP